MTEIRTAIVLAAGQGTKCWPYSVVRNKTAFPIANVPAIRRLVDDLLSLGVSRIVAVVGAGEGSVRAALRDCDGDVVYVRQPRPEGTASAALLGARGLEEDVLVVAGDLVTARENLVTILDAARAVGIESVNVATSSQ